jgi:CBS domain-containing protein
MTNIAELMTPHPVTVSPQDSVQHAAQLMDELNVGALPVCQGVRLLGIVTDRDITVRATAAGLDPRVTEVELVMSDRVRCCLGSESADDVLRQMSAVQIRRLPVVDETRRLIGIVSLGDLAARRASGVQEALCHISTPSAPDRTAMAA